MDEPRAAEPRTAEGVEHLQAAARELLAAARSFLDVVEEVVEDDQRFSGAASSVADLVRTTAATLGSAAPWDRSAGSSATSWATREPAWMRNDPDHPDSPDPDSPDLDSADPVDLTDGADEQRSTSEDPALEHDAPKAAPAAVARKPATAPRAASRSSRVKRIAVD